MAHVSVVIPTRDRPELVARAIQSVRQQTFSDLEIIIVIDGPDPQTIQALREIDDERLRWVALAESVGGAEARNVGVRHASGHWVALLDDDDEWFPEKLMEQLKESLSASARCIIITRFIDSRPNARIVQPGLPPRPRQPISEYLFAETSVLGFRNGFMQTSTWLAPRQVFMDVPFTKGLPRNQETDWLIRAVPALELEVRVVWKTLAIFHNESSVGRITSRSDWRDTMRWAVSGGHFTPKALAFFFATVCVPGARLSGAPTSVFWSLLKTAREAGSEFTAKSAWLFFASWFVFPYGRFGLRSRLQNVLNLRVRSVGGING
jgi:glycosyltransferase involved in cell wall biosynthesis